MCKVIRLGTVLSDGGCIHRGMAIWLAQVSVPRHVITDYQNRSNRVPHSNRCAGKSQRECVPAARTLHSPPGRCDIGCACAALRMQQWGCKFNRRVWRDSQCRCAANNVNVRLFRTRTFQIYMRK